MRTSAILLAVVLLAAPAAQQPAQSKSEVPVRIETAFGNIDLAIDVVRAPITAGNFLKYVDGGFYDGGRVHRATRAENYKPNLPNRPPLEIIQADINPARAGERFPPIPLERTSVTGLTHVVGTVSMPRADDKPDSARSGFVIHLNDQPSLNHGGMRFDDGQGTAAFGRVVAGLDVVRTIQQQPVQGQSLAPPIEIKKAYRIRPAGAGEDLKTVVAGLNGLSLHDQCTGDYPPQPDVRCGSRRDPELTRLFPSRLLQQLFQGSAFPEGDAHVSA